jgi:hypothetical protein
MGMHSKWIQGNLVFYDSLYEHRWLDAIGPTVTKALEEFVSTPFSAADSPSGYTTTEVDVGLGDTTVTLLAATIPGGHLVIAAAENENDGAQIQRLGEAFLLANLKPCYFGCRFKVSEATQSDFVVGLTITTATLIAGGATEGVYFSKVDGATACNFTLMNASTPTATAVLTVAANTFYTVEFVWNGAAIDSWVDGVLQTRPAITNLPQAQTLTPSIAFLSGAAGAGKTMTIDWMRAIQIQ